jgi:DNA-binding transcriptional regulator YiaG
MSESICWREYSLQARRNPVEKCASVTTADLNQAVALALAQSTSELGPDAFKFLRKALCLSQADIADILDLSKHTVSSWERGCVPLPRYADLLLRALVREALEGTAALGQVIGMFCRPIRAVTQQATALPTSSL